MPVFGASGVARRFVLFGRIVASAKRVRATDWRSRAWSSSRSGLVQFLPPRKPRRRRRRERSRAEFPSDRRAPLDDIWRPTAFSADAAYSDADRFLECRADRRSRRLHPVAETLGRGGIPIGRTQAGWRHRLTQRNDLRPETREASSDPQATGTRVVFAVSKKG